MNSKSVALSGLLAFIAVSCAVAPPKLDRSYLPLRYIETSVPWTIEVKAQPAFRIVLINPNDDRNQALVRHWRGRYFDSIFKKRHPVLDVYLADISNLESYLSKVLDIFYVQLESAAPQSLVEIKQLIVRHIHCEPLSNLEIRFIMNADSMTTFSQKPLSMLMISAHELMLQLGATPEYPKIVSPFLRKRYGFSDIKKIEDANIFALKKTDSPYPLKVSGFVVCRKAIYR